jgi:hypothetical protein
MEHLRNYLTIFLVENSDSSNMAKKWSLGVRYHNNNWCNWRICYPREVSCRPLRLELYFTVEVVDNDGQTHRLYERLYPSCYFINMPNKYKTIKPGETYEHIIDITPWRDSKGMWIEPEMMYRNSVVLSKSSKRLWEDLQRNEKRVEGTFFIIVTYPHVHHYAAGRLKWKGWY